MTSADYARSEKVRIGVRGRNLGHEYGGDLRYEDRYDLRFS